VPIFFKPNVMITHSNKAIKPRQRNAILDISYSTMKI
jgi:hypothetical protein